MFASKAGAYTGKTLYGDVSGIADEAGKACHASLLGPSVSYKEDSVVNSSPGQHLSSLALLGGHQFFTLIFWTHN